MQAELNLDLVVDERLDGRSFGYFHAPVEVFTQGLSDKAVLLFLRMLSDHSLGQDTPEDFFANDLIVGELIHRGMIEPDGDDWRIFEPEEWNA